VSTFSPTIRRLTVPLWEEVQQPGRRRVDRAAGVVYGVKVLGTTSPNSHGVRGVDGTVYTADALRRAAPLYEGVAVNADHPPRSQPNAERSSWDRLGRLRNVRVERDGTFADLHLLKSHPLAERVLEAATSMPDAYALSHNAVGKGEARGGKYVVTEIPEVHSVDLVADGGTNRSLFEGARVVKTASQWAFQLLEGAGAAEVEKTAAGGETDTPAYAARRKLIEEIHGHLIDGNHAEARAAHDRLIDMDAAGHDRSATESRKRPRRRRAGWVLLTEVRRSSRDYE
jgi:hypothetical protein